MLRIVCVFILVLLVCPAFAQRGEPTPVLLVVIEGLRPEFVSAELMPVLFRMGVDGVQSTAHHPVFPTTTNPNRASIVTGMTPAKHGVLTRDDKLATPTVIDVLSDAGITARAERAVDFAADKAAHFTLVTIPWIAETQEEQGVGSPASLGAIRSVDAQLELMFEGYKQHEISANVIVISDRGMVPVKGPAIDLGTLLIENGFKAGPESDEVRVVGGNSIAVKDRNRELIGRIVRWMQREPWAGVIYTQQARPTHPESFVRGALSFQAVYMDHPSAPDILVEAVWSDEGNLFAYEVSGTVGYFEGAETLSSGPHAMEAVLIASGPAFKASTVSKVPSAQYDIAPTVCALFGVDVPASMEGRVLRETFRDGPAPDSVKVVRRRHGSQGDWEGGFYRTMMHEATVDGVDYLEQVDITRQ